MTKRQDIVARNGVTWQYQRISLIPNDADIAQNLLNSMDY